MNETPRVPVAIVGVSAILPDAPDAGSFWDNVTNGRYSISDVDPDRWDPEFYYDPDPHALDKTYSRIGGWVREWEWNPRDWKLPIPPKVAEQMDDGQKWAVNCARAALVDYGWPQRPIDTERTAVIIGNALAGEKHYQTALRIAFPELAKELDRSPSFAALPGGVRDAILAETQSAFQRDYPDITEDTMPGELANVIAGRVANLFNLRGPNFTSDAACASALAAMTTGVAGLAAGDFDTVITGGLDRNMGVAAFVKFCKIGALSATGTRPYGAGADGFVMGEGAALFLLKRLADAERDGDRVYAVIRGIAGSSDGRGKGITAPNPVGQKLAMERAWKAAGLSPAAATLVEGHGTSTRVGDVVEVQAMTDVFGGAGASPGAIALGSVKSNIGHLKGAAGAAGMLKAVFALHHRVLPPSINARTPNPDIDFAHSPLRVNHELCEWPTPTGDGVRCAGVSAFGFGGTNFHVVLEEHMPGRIPGNGSRSFAIAAPVAAENGAGRAVEVSAPPPSEATGAAPSAVVPQSSAPKPPLRGALVVGAATRSELVERLSRVERKAREGTAPAPQAPQASDLRAAERVAIDYGDAAELAEKAAAALKALALEERADAAPMWKALRARGVHRGRGPAPRVAFLYTGQGSQYANMLAQLRAVEPVVDRTFAEADRIMSPLLGRPLSDYVFVDGQDPAAMERAEASLRETEITQPAVMAADLALTRLLAAYGITPDMAMGHSLGEYGALMTAGSLTFEHTLEAVSARGREMSQLTIDDRGVMAAVFAPLAEVEAAVQGVDGCIVANVNSTSQSVIGGATPAVRAVMEKLAAAEYMVVELPVSHAFHTSIVAPVSVPLRAALLRLELQPPRLPIVSNVTGELYPTGEGALEAALDLLSRQVASPVQFIAGLRTLYREGARVFIEVGPKRALAGFAEDVLGAEPDVATLFTNHPKTGDIVSFNQALCGLYAAGLGAGVDDHTVHTPAMPHVDDTSDNYYTRMGRLVHDIVVRESGGIIGSSHEPVATEPVVITGASLGLPKLDRLFDDANVGSILAGDQYIGAIPQRLRDAIVDKHIVRLVKRESGDPTFEAIDDASEVIKLAARGAALDLVEDFGLVSDRVAAYDRATVLAIGAGIDALRDAGIPLVLRYRTTSKGTLLPDRYVLPEALRDDTGVIFASAFPGYDSLVGYLNDYHNDRTHRALLEELRGLRQALAERGVSAETLADVDRRVAEAEAAVERETFTFDRRFLFRALSMGHSQLAELIGARGPNTQVNSACASTTQAMAIAEDWIRAGRCRRVIVVAADDATSDNLLEWLASGFLASGAAATDEVVEDAALPFDRRRHGMLLGMGAAGIVIESAAAARERAITPICEQLACVTANSAFHGTRLDVTHISQVMEQLVAQAERAAGIDRREIARELLFVSHETYTPARGGSAAAEVEALRAVFGDDAGSVLIANTKGFTGHPMGVGIEDVVAIKALETGIVPPVPNFREPDPELGTLRLSTGGSYPVRYALRLAAGFGSQISMSLLRWVPAPDAVRRSPDQLGYAYRINDRVVWAGWLAHLTGRPDVELEVVKRTLRVREESTPAAPVPHELPVTTPVAAAATEAPLSTTTRQTPAAPVMATAAMSERVEPPQAEEEPAPAPAVSSAPARAPTTAPAVAATASAVAAPPALDEDAVRARVLGLVAEKTGYPEDMLEVDLDLEADLGVDTVKQAELFAVIRESYGIERDENLRLRDMPTLAHVIRFVIDRLPQTEVGSQQATVSPAAAGVVPVQATNGPTPPPEGASITPRDDGAAAVAQPAAETNGAEPSMVGAVDEEAVRQRVLELVAEKTGYPEDMLDVDLDLEADLGVDTVKQAELFAVIRESYGMERDENLRLRDMPTLAHVIRFVIDRLPHGGGDGGGSGGGGGAPAEPPASTTNGSAPTLVELTGKPGATDRGMATPPVAALDEDAVRARVLELVAEKTGYPEDMLDVDLDLEADLGVDTVKQAELFAVIRESYGIERDEALRLRDMPTLAHVIRFVVGRASGRAEGRAAAEVPVAAEEPAPAAPSPRRPAPDASAADRIPRRVPVAVPRAGLELCGPTAVTLSPDSRIVITRDAGGVGEALAERLRALGATPLLVDVSRDADTLKATLRSHAAAGTIQGVYWLPALDVEPQLTELDLPRWRENLRRRVKQLYTAMRTLDSIGRAGTFLVSATRLGGRHGYDAPGATAPMGGAVTGFTKAFARERPDAVVKAVDHPLDANPELVAERLVAETLCDPGAVEVGYAHNTRWTVGLEEQPAADGGPGMVLGPESVVVVTGAAGGIVSAITADLAAASGGSFHLLDLTPAPDRDDPDLARIDADREGLKRDLVARLRQGGEKVTPVMVDRRLAAIERQAAALVAIRAVEAAGGHAHYHCVDLTHAAPVAAIIDEIKQRHGRIDVLLHAAGLEISRLLPDKPPKEFDLVFDVKSDGLFTLLRAVGDMPLSATVMFSSVAGRFGNGGQTDYSAANDLLCKVTSSLRSTRPGTRAIAIDWTAWGGIGMATRGSIPKMMELAGIDMLPPEVGIPTVRRELCAGATRGEVVVADRLGILVEERAASTGAGGSPVLGAGPMVESLVALGEHGPQVTEVTLDPARHRFLDDHRIEGTPVLPGVMSMEAFAEAALLPLNGWHVAAVEDVDFLAPFKFYRDQPRTVTVVVRFRSGDSDDELVAECALLGTRTLAGKQPQTTTHATGRVRLRRSPGAPENAAIPGAPVGVPAKTAELYRVYFHGPAYRVLDSAWQERGTVVGRMVAELPADTDNTSGPPVQQPRLAELCFQTAGVRELGVDGVLGLPTHVDAVTALPVDGPASPATLHAVTRLRDDGRGVDAEVVDSSGHVRLRMRGYRTTPLPLPVGEDLLAPFRTAMA